MNDRINYYESFHEREFPSWKKGKEKREKLLSLYKTDPRIPLEQASKILGLSVQQVKRHRRNLIAEGLLKLGVFLLIFSNAPYYELQEQKQSIDEFIENHVKSPVLEWKEEIVWRQNLWNL